MIEANKGFWPELKEIKKEGLRKLLKVIYVVPPFCFYFNIYSLSS